MNYRDQDLTGQNFDGQDLSYALLRGANLTNCSFVGTNLSYANMRGCIIEGADFTDAEMFYCNPKDATGAATFTNAKAYGIPTWIPMPGADIESTPPMMNVVREIFIQYGTVIDENNSNQIEYYYDLADDEKAVLLGNDLEVPTNRNLYIAIYGDAPSHDEQILSKILYDAKESNISFNKKLDSFY